MIYYSIFIPAIIFVVFACLLIPAVIYRRRWYRETTYTFTTHGPLPPPPPPVAQQARPAQFPMGVNGSYYAPPPGAPPAAHVDHAAGGYYAPTSAPRSPGQDDLARGQTMQRDSHDADVEKAASHNQHTYA